MAEICKVHKLEKPCELCLEIMQTFEKERVKHTVQNPKGLTMKEENVLYKGDMTIAVNLVNTMLVGHSDPESEFYHGCDNEKCEWCWNAEDSLVKNHRDLIK